ncbi:MAG: sulfurtransferase [Actinotalea sp.]|nr:sulfurtransferase [Actinotalea sp.]
MTYAGDLTPRQAWELLTSDERALLVDVRTEREWREIGVPQAPADAAPAFVEWSDARGRPDPAFVERIRELGVEPGDERPVLLLCRSGVRSVHAARALTAAGLGPAFNVLEGFEGAADASGRRGHEGWRAAGLPWRRL